MARKLTVEFIGDTKSFEQASGRVGDKGKMLAKGLAGLGAAALAAGKALYDIGGQFDDAYDTIRVGTGKTGKALEGLQKDFKAVVKGVPASFDDAGEAIADLNTRLGLTGKPLQDRAKQFLELSRITKTDVKTNIEAVTRAFGDWEVKTGQQGKQLDKFFRASQNSGASVEDLARSVVQFGAPLRQVGFSLDEATALFASFEKAGVNTQTMMPGLKMALKTFMQQGRDPAKALRETFEGIANGTIDSTEALKIFGTRAGPDMVEAIRQGRFEIDKLTKDMLGGGDTIRKAGRDTMDFAEQWQMFKNRVMVWLEPIAVTVFGAIGTAMERLPAIVARVRDAFSAWLADNRGKVDGFRDTLNGIKDTIAGVVTAASAVWARFGDLIVRYLQGAANSVVKIATGIGKTIKGLVDLVAGVVTGDWKRAWGGITGIVGGAWNVIEGIIGGALNTIRTLVSASLRGLGVVIGGIWDGIKSAAAGAWNTFKSFITTPVSAAASLVRNTLGQVGLTGWLGAAWTNIKTAAQSAWNTFKSFISTPVSAAASLVRNTLGQEGLTGWLGSVWNTIRSGARVAWEAFRDRIVDPVRDAVSAVKAAIGNAKDGLIGWLGDRVDDVKNAAEALAKPFVAAFRKMRDAVKDVLDWLGKVLGKVEDVVKWIGKIKIPKINIPIIGGGGAGTGDGRVGPAPKVSGVDSFNPIAKSFGNMVTSGYRPGDKGWHGQNRARDYAGGDMLGFARYMAAVFGGRLLELIHTPLGFGIKNGQKVPMSFFGGDVAADHYDHVHVAMADGGHVKRSGWAMVGELGPELVRLPSGSTVFPTGTGPAGGDVVHVHHVYLDGKELDVKIDSRVERRDRAAAAAYTAGVLA